MGLFDVFMSKEGKIKKHHRRVTNIDAPEEDRDASMRWLAAEGSPQAILALLARLDMTLDHQLKDAAEKDLAQELVLSRGKDAVAPVRRWLKTCKGTARPLQILTDLEGEAAALDAVYELLEAELDGDPFKPEKKKKLLIWLADHKDARAVEAATPFLTDFDEGVRYAAAEVLIAQEDDATRAPLQRVFTNPEEDSNRLKARVADVFIARRWTVDDPETVAAALPHGYAVNGDRIVKA